MWFFIGLIGGFVLGWIANDRKVKIKAKASETLRNVNNKVKDL